MSGTTHDAEPPRDSEPPTSDGGGTDDSPPTTVRVVDRRDDSSTDTGREPPQDDTEPTSEPDPAADGRQEDADQLETERDDEVTIVELDPWPLVSIGMLLGAIIVVLLLHLLGVI